MWVKPWKLAVGFLIGGGLFAVGLALQLTMGPIDWSLFAAPVNWIMLGLLLGVLVPMFLLRKINSFFSELNRKVEFFHALFRFYKL